MLTAAIQKQYAIVYFTQSKIENLILSFLIWNFAIEYISFSKEKEFNNGFMTDIAKSFFYYLQEGSLTGKRKGKQKSGTMEKLFIIKPVYCFKLMTLSN